ncbi:MAG TPA: amino acid permease, partial [Blastocatellia bacterium]|nr:amino acid permease [Blastocatellia bacterium]
ISMSVASQKPIDHISEDVRDLGALGYAQELFRTIGGFSNFAISFSIISILTGAVTLYGHGLTMGGPAEMAFGWPLVTLFTLMVAMSMAELASSLPTSGAMYHWSSRLGGKTWGWFTAWFNLAGQVTTLAAIDYGCAQFVTPLVGLEATTRNLLAVYAAILTSHALINAYGIRLVALLNDFSVTVHIVGVVAIVEALFLFAPKQPASFFFARVTSNTQGWPYWWAFIIGLLQAQWTFTGYDASASVSEETVDPRRRAPWGMVMAVAVSSLVGYLLLIALTLAIRDIHSVLDAKDASGNDIPAVITILRTALGDRAGGVFSGLAAMAMWFCGLSAVTWNSRLIYAFSRDGGLPLSEVWKHVSKRRLTPGPAIWLCVVVAFMAAVYAGAYPVVTSISVIGLYFSYIIPVFLAWRARGRGNEPARGPWNLGRWGAAVNVIAIVWVVFISIVLSTPDNMRPGKTIAGFVVLLVLWYLLRERRRFKGPAFAQRRDE